MKLLITLLSSALILSLVVQMASADDSVKLAPGIRLVAFNQFPELSVPTGMEQYRHAYFVIVNDSDRAITAVSVIWSYTSIETGQHKAAIMKTLDSYMLDRSQFRPVAAPHTRAPLEPGLAGAHAFKDARDGQITFTVDAIVFDDGEIIGQDTMRTGEEITARYAAAREASARFHMGRLAGKSIDRIAQEIHQLPPADGIAFNRWREHFSRRILASMEGDATLTALHLKSLDSMPEPPTFYKNEK